MRITYIGERQGTSLHRAMALQRLGHETSIIDPLEYVGKGPWVGPWIHHAGALGASVFVDSRISQRVRESRPHLIWVNQGEFLGPRLISRLREHSVPIINYTNDDPFGGRDRMRFRLYLKALPYYDLLVVVREPNVADARRHGSRRVVRVFMSADEVAHRPRQLSDEERLQYSSEVAFVGTWMPERGRLFAELIHLGVPLSIWGDRWDKATEWGLLRKYWRGPGLYDDRYAKVISAAHVALGLVSSGNRDLHTTRSMEIPALRGVLCAQRTNEHSLLYMDGVEALFWSTPRECALVCQRLLSNHEYRQQVADAGYERARKNNHFNEAVAERILREAFSAPATIRSPVS